ncbi:uncharacterized protein LOC113208717 isoform X2 [Frankliniella occidentalis]|uniref:Uncharacterized protein LOC113208717 isoform X2 n=2 Tax=Frankliniella occidentalis TaxID=133901 RepID=A0A9C6WYI9_FRAOC|nr:uncharacterized protein LOC113208717 isoform X2 [Frankliniella occidentalis]
MERQHQEGTRDAGGWCWDCRAAAEPRSCRQHEVLDTEAALGRHLQGVMAEAASQLGGLLGQCQRERALQALTLLATESWDLTLRGGGRELKGTVRDTEDPLVKAVWLVLATRAALTEVDLERGGEMGTQPESEREPIPEPSILAAQCPPAEEADQPRLEVNVSEICARDDSEEKAAALGNVIGVERLVGVYCHSDPAWSLQLLQRAAPTVEQLSVMYSREPHLRAVHAMPRLRRLFVWGDDGALDAKPPELPPLPPGHGNLRWLTVWLPRATLQSLLQAHGHSLEELALLVGTAGDEAWPSSCSDLHSLLGQCGLRALQRLVLWRVVAWLHDTAACCEQRTEVRRVLPAAEVLCSLCDPAVTGRF